MIRTDHPTALRPDDAAVPLVRPRPRILAVDDDERNLLAVCEVLDSVGEVVCARSGTEALRCLLRDEFAVILLDVLMPDMDGYETATLIRQREQSRRTPIIFLSAINKDEAHLLQGYDAGAVDYVFKPFDTLVLRSKVSVFVDLYEKTREVQETAAREQRLLEAALRAQAEKLEAEAKLDASRLRQEAMLRALPVVFHSRGVEHPHPALFVSDSVEAMTGFSPQRFTSEPDFGFSRIHPEDRTRVEAAHQEAAAAGVYSCEYRWQAADGSWKVFLDQGVIAPPEEGQPPALFGTLLDITEHRHLEEQLAQARKMETVGQLTGGIAHDFNNLLASVLSGLALLERRAELPESVRPILDMTRHAAQQGADLIDRMLAFSRRQQLRPSAVHIPALAQALEGLIGPVLGGLVRLQWRLGDEVWPAHADRSQLELAMMNLVINARDAMPQGGTIGLSAENAEVGAGAGDLAAGDYVVIAVEDSGTGMGPEILARVLEPFFTTKEVGKGTGLGLSMAYGFARQSGGTLRIDSEPGRGTRVELWLPRSRSLPVADAPSGWRAAVKAREPGASGSRPEVLLVDDSATLRELTATMLREHGFAVATAAGGAEALSLIEREPDRFDVIVTDFAMPLVSGLDVIRFARNHRPDWPAVMVSGYADASAIEDRPGDVVLLKKPFPPEALVEAIVNGLEQGSAAPRRAASR
ncbi:putative sensor/response regulator hybrid protein [Rubellimicrobium mesophilum DSM 19309]|uniref:histidine kinase n=1 Tax=Rubellimicrobium mesophilum DSM 19309 TaxID=442562 RepID=A0A017HP34_9RHOB|nr:response regulator [Rubellimicrobium mesophilum]EYD76035.1 putative sensor/response regulator hybrid protein [Rubellimicrobium mesophilum DSM 19309]